MRGLLKSTQNRIKRVMGRSIPMEALNESLAESVEMAASETGAGPAPDKDEQPKLLVIGNGTAFSEEVVTYALDMAKRMSYEILALNAAPLRSGAWHAKSTDQLRADFKAQSETNAAEFGRQAETASVRFIHEVRFADQENAIKQVAADFGAIEFVVSDHPEHIEERPEIISRPQNELYVYSMLT